MAASKRRSEPSPDTEYKKAKIAVQKCPKRTDDEGKDFWELSSKRRIAISEFKGTTFLAIREYYEKDGKMLPGKQGINLNLDQLASLILTLPNITNALAEKGFILPAIEVPAISDKIEEPPEESENDSVLG